MVAKGVLAWLVLGIACLVARGQAGPALSSSQQAVLLEQAGSYFYVSRYATIDLDSSIITAARSLGISLLPLLTEAAPEEIPTNLSTWVANGDPSAGRLQLPRLARVQHVQQLYLLGAWYAFQSTTHANLMDSATQYLLSARTEAKQINAGNWTRRTALLLAKVFLGKNDTISANAWFHSAIDECHHMADRRGEAIAWRYWAVYFPLLPGLAPERIGYLKNADAQYLTPKNDFRRINILTHIGFQSFSIVRMADAKSNFEEALRLEDSLHWPYTHYTTEVLSLIAERKTEYDDMLRYTIRTIKSAEKAGDSLCLANFYLRQSIVYFQLPLFRNEYIHWAKAGIDRLLISDGELDRLSMCQSTVRSVGKRSSAQRDRSDYRTDTPPVSSKK